MRKKWKKQTATLLTILTVLAGTVHPAFAATFQIDPSADNRASQMLMDGVNLSMLTPSYWTSFPESKELLMNKEQIKAFNEDCLNNPECNMNRIDALEKETFNGINMRQNLLSDTVVTSKLYLNGQPVPDSYYEAVREQIRNAPAGENMNVGYAICLKRCVMSSIPCEDAIADDVTDPEWDQFALSPVLYNEPLVTYLTTANGRFTYVKSYCCSGWVPTDCIAVCHSKEEWMSTVDPKDFLVITGDKVQTERSYNDWHSELTLEMGVRLELCFDGLETVDNRMNWCNFVVYAPGRGADGLYEKRKMLIPAGSDVCVGYLPMTYSNIAQQAFKSLGTRYGWGGSESAQDCSSYVREVYLCFRLCLPRNTSWQAMVNSKKVDLSKMTVNEKKDALNDLPLGTILQFPGHEMLYLGTKNGKYYTINDVSSIGKDTEDGIKKMRVRSVVINSLGDTKRANGKTWLEELTKAIVVFE